MLLMVTELFVVIEAKAKAKVKAEVLAWSTGMVHSLKSQRVKGSRGQNQITTYNHVL